jgi:hypothetical protein
MSFVNYNIALYSPYEALNSYIIKSLLFTKVFEPIDILY